MGEEKNIKLILAYDGGHYHGWQRQINAQSIQGILEDKIRRMTNEPVTLHASGRTDAGVHALNQVCNFKTSSKIDPDSIKRGLNSLLPDDILIKQSDYVPLEFHSRYSAKSKTYEYRILNQSEPGIFERHYAWHIPFALDLDIMRNCLTCLLGEHDFSSFKSTGSANLNPVRNMFMADIQGPDQGILYFIFEADGFLRHMVRSIVGTIVDAGSGKINVEEFTEILKAKDRQAAGVKAPPQGLFLIEVKY